MSAFQKTITASISTSSSIATPHFNMIITSRDDLASKVMFTRYPDMATEVQGNLNAIHQAGIRLSPGTGGATAWTIWCLGEEYSGEETFTLIDGGILLRVISCARVDSGDLVGVDFEVENTSGIVIKALIVWDSVAQRFNVPHNGEVWAW